MPNGWRLAWVLEFMIHITTDRSGNGLWKTIVVRPLFLLLTLLLSAHPRQAANRWDARLTLFRLTHFIENFP